jgi:hypothetical protein
MEKNLHKIGKEKPKNHKIFVDDEKDLEQFEKNRDQNKAGVKVSSLNELRESESNDFDETNIDDQPSEKKKKNQNISEIIEKYVNRKIESSYKELSVRKERSQQLTKALHTLSLQRNLMSKGTKRKIIIESDASITYNSNKNDEDNTDNDNSKVVYKWKRERQR